MCVQLQLSLRASNDFSSQITLKHNQLFPAATFLFWCSCQMWRKSFVIDFLFFGLDAFVCLPGDVRSLHCNSLAAAAATATFIYCCINYNQVAKMAPAFRSTQTVRKWRNLIIVQHLGLLVAQRASLSLTH